MKTPLFMLLGLLFSSVAQAQAPVCPACQNVYVTKQCKFIDPQWELEMVGINSATGKQVWSKHILSLWPQDRWGHLADSWLKFGPNPQAACLAMSFMPN
jgi:hypothetical protein